MVILAQALRSVIFPGHQTNKDENCRLQDEGYRRGQLRDWLPATYPIGHRRTSIGVVQGEVEGVRVQGTLMLDGPQAAGQG